MESSVFCASTPLGGNTSTEVTNSPCTILRDHFERYMTIQLENFAIADGEIEDGGSGRLVKHGNRV